MFKRFRSSGRGKNPPSSRFTPRPSGDPFDDLSLDLGDLLQALANAGVLTTMQHVQLSDLLKAQQEGTHKFETPMAIIMDLPTIDQAEAGKILDSLESCGPMRFPCPDCDDFDGCIKPTAVLYQAKLARQSPAT